MNQTLKLTDRKSFEITCVKKLISFNKNEFLVNTPLGDIKVNGKNLTIGKMDTQKEELTILGDIESISYLSIKSKQEKKEGIFTKLFK